MGSGLTPVKVAVHLPEAIGQLLPVGLTLAMGYLPKKVLNKSDINARPNLRFRAEEDATEVSEQRQVLSYRRVFSHVLIERVCKAFKPRVSIGR